MKRVFMAMMAVAAVSAGPVWGQAGSYRFTLDDCLRYAIGNNYKHQSYKLAEESKQISLSQSRQERLPDLNASASENFSHRDEGSAWSGSYGVNTGVTLFSGGAIGHTIAQNRLSAGQSAYMTAQYENQLTIQILQAFLSVLGNEELLKYQESVVGASAEQVKQGKAQFEAGTILESDYLMLQAQYANDMNNIEDTRISRENNLLTLKGLLSLAPTDDLQVVHPDTAVIAGMGTLPAMQAVLDRAMATLPDLEISRYNVDIANLGVKLSKAGYAPTLSASAGIGTGYTGGAGGYGPQLSDRFNQSAGLSLSIPIYGNGRTRSKVAQSRISLRQAELDQKQAELDVAQDVAMQYNDVQSAWNKYRTTGVRQNAYYRTFEAYRVQYANDAITPVDLLQQQNNYISALNDYIQSKYGFMLKRKILDVYMGVPVTM